MKAHFSAIREAVKQPLVALRKSEPKTASVWADENFYLSSESSYISGRWKTLDFQKAPLNAMGNDNVGMVDFIKSARVGFSKMLMANTAYKVEHKKRNVSMFLPNDSAAKEFCKQEIDTMIRDVPSLRDIFPYFDKKSSKNTVTLKQFIGSTIYIRGGKSGKNYRAISVDEVILDELDAFDPDIETEGEPSGLAWKRTEGSSFRKMIRGTTPKIKGDSQIEAAVDKAEHLFKYYVPCPHCGEYQDLRFGGKDTAFGLKWIDEDPKTVMYQCPHCSSLIENNELPKISEKGYWFDPNTEVKTVDGLVYRDRDDVIIDTPYHIAFHVWTIYSPFTTWREIVIEWLAAKKDPLKLKTFINTTLGETFDLNTGETVDPHKLKRRAESFFTDPLPEKVCYITAGIDQQPDRFEIQVLGWGKGRECWVLNYEILYCDVSLQESWDVTLDEYLDSLEFKHPSGNILTPSYFGIDTGGSATQEAYAYCVNRYHKGRLAMKGMAGEGKPIIPVQHSTSWKMKGIKGWNVGVDTAKEAIYHMLSIEMDGHGFIHFPDSGLPDDYYDQLTSETRKLKIDRNGRRKYEWWKPAHRRNEALDTFGYALAALEHARPNYDHYMDLLQNDKESSLDSALSRLA